MSEMKPDDVLAILRADRLPECSFDNGMTWVTDDVLVAETFSRAADALDTLLAEIAALRVDLSRKHDACQIAQDQAMENGSRLAQAKRQRDEAVGLLRDAVDPYEHISDVRAFEVMKNGPATRLVAIRTFLASMEPKT